MTIIIIIDRGCLVISKFQINIRDLPLGQVPSCSSSYLYLAVSQPPNLFTNFPTRNKSMEVVIPTDKPQ